MLHCEECRCVSEDACDWIAHLVDDEEDPGAETYVVAYSPACAEREFHREPRSRYT
jgi:hypothetical protein